MAVGAAGAALAAGRAVAGPGPGDMRSNFAFKKDEKPVILEVAINGGTLKKRNPLVPETPAELAEEAIKCFDEGVTIVHFHSNKPSSDLDAAVAPYAEAMSAIRKKHPRGIIYPTANFDPKVYHEQRTVWEPEIQSGHQRRLAKAGLANMVLFDTGVLPLATYDRQGRRTADKFWWYGFWPGDDDVNERTCKDFGCGASISVFEPGWMKNVVAMARAGRVPRGSKLNIYFADYGWAGMAPPIPEALQLYLHMIEGLDLEWDVGLIGGDIMDTPLARMSLERGGAFRVGLEDWMDGPSNLDQIKRAKELIAKVGRPILTGDDAIEHLDIPFPGTRP